MSEVNEQAKPGPNGDTAAVASWNKKLSALDKSSFPEKGPNTRKPPVTKAGSLPEGKTYKDSGDSKKSKFEAIKAARENKKKGQVQEDNDFTSFDLVEAMIDKKPGNFMSMFDIMLLNKVTDLVAERRLYITDALFNAQEADDEDEVDTDQTEGDEENEDAETSDEADETSDVESEDETVEEEEEINELSAGLKKRYAVAAKADAKRRAGSPAGRRVRPKLLKRFMTAKKAMGEEEETDETNTKPHIFGKKSGNSEKKAHQQDTINRLRKISVTKVEKSAA